MSETRTGDGAAMSACRHCGASFTPIQPHHHFCTPQCRQAAFAASAVVVKVRLSAIERRQLDAAAAEQGDSLSGLVREALCQMYGVGAWPVPSSLVSPLGHNARPPHAS